MLTEVADGVWVRQSAWVWSNAIVVRGEDGLVLVDPGIEGSELDELADEVERLGLPVVAGFCTHPHWDHLLWHPRFGDVPALRHRCLCPDGDRRTRAGAGDGGGERLGHPPRAGRAVSPLPADGGPVPGTLVEHEAHAVGHAAVLLADRGVLLAGDMLSDVLIPLLDPVGPVRWAPTGRRSTGWVRPPADVDVVVPGHGAVAEGAEVAARLAADRAYIDALRRGEEPVDARLEQDWLSGPHESNLELARNSSSDGRSPASGPGSRVDR